MFLVYVIIKRVKGTLYVSCNYRECLRFLGTISEVEPGGWKRALATRILLAKQNHKPMKLQWNFPQELGHTLGSLYPQLALVNVIRIPTIARQGDASDQPGSLCVRF